uniref:Ubiquinone/menaquinone biosynthesis C-methylase UbiE n=1 Tax=Candidatus Kentrum sp. LPFa TaxID=2126335 RepID=A0A450XZ18_9GAMM|nr:MAG: Ubiquinone/menaquinone biosynthesis C-methylase UbiE [Candidatus Kentron sp. LPFa]VFK34548.1 MAG: Ubiquinone/menaquinone biosynthesis C-methylase UbiE [Candidatus Kentron sp. LPFa]
MTAYYDGIAKQYQKLDLPARHVNAYTHLNLIGNVAGQSILDLACGTGYYTRMFKPSAKYVVGVDISEKMIEIARQEEAREPLGIEYLVCDVAELGKIGDFDLVVAAFLLHYAQTKEQLLEMCRNISVNLKTGGRFVTINGNLEMPPELYPKLQKYGATRSVSEPLREGTPITLTFTVKGERFSFDNYYLSKATYEWAFRQAGFKEVHWREPMVSPEGLQKFGQAFWQDALDYSCNWFIECLK